MPDGLQNNPYVGIFRHAPPALLSPLQVEVEVGVTEIEKEEDEKNEKGEDKKHYTVVETQRMMEAALVLLGQYLHSQSTRHQIINKMS